MCCVAMTEPNKLIICGSFAECYTRQKSYLPSTMKNTLGKAFTWQKSLHSGTKMASLPSVCARTLGKEAKILCILGRVCRVPSIRHSAKDEGLLSASNVTHDKVVRVCRVLDCDTWQSSKSLPSAGL